MVRMKKTSSIKVGRAAPAAGRTSPSPDGAVVYLPQTDDVFPKCAQKFVGKLKRDARLSTAFLKKAGILGRDGKLVKSAAANPSHLY